MNGLKKALVVGAMSAAMLLTGCSQPGAATGGRATSSGSLALSSDDSLLYAVDTDNGVVAAIDTNSQTRLYSVKVGDRPARVVVGVDDTVYVTNRGDNSVSIIRKGEQTVSKTIDVGTEPVGLAISPDNKTLYVVNATAADTSDYGTLTGIDVATLQPTFELKLGSDPRGIVLLSNDRAVISLYKTGELVEVDLKARKVLTPNGIGIYPKANETNQTGTGGLGSAAFSTFRARAMTDLVATPDGTRVFAPVVWAREDPIGRRPTAAGGYYSSGGPCNVGAVASAGLVVADLGNSNAPVSSGGSGGALQPQVDDLTKCISSGTTDDSKDYPASTLGQRSTSSDPTVANPSPIQGPSAVAVDATGNWLYVVNKESSTVAVMPAFRRTGEDLNFQNTGSSVRFVVPVGQGADGIALTRDGKRAFVYSQFDHRVDLLGSVGQDNNYRVTKTASIPVANDTLTGNLVNGRKLFFNATDLRISAGTTTVSCATCHLEGLEDGHTWSFPDGPRQTPALAGRHLSQTAPYHWSGEFGGATDQIAFTAFMKHTITERMGGTGLLAEKENQDISDYIESIPAPKNANLKGALTAVQLRGKHVYETARCATCHGGALLTNNAIVDVGTLVTTGRNPDFAGQTTDLYGKTRGLNVPSLIGIARTAPYLHDGSATTLRARLDNDNNGLHGTTAGLSDGEKDDLVAYLKTL